MQESVPFLSLVNRFALVMNKIWKVWSSIRHKIARVAIVTNCLADTDYSKIKLNYSQIKIDK